MSNLTVPAFPVMPLQDNFQRLVVPVPGLSKLEHFTLEIYKSCVIKGFDEDHTEIMKHAMYVSIELLTLLENKTKELSNEKTIDKPIFDF